MRSRTDIFSHHYVSWLTHYGDGSKPEVQHEVLLEDVPDCRRGVEDGGPALELDSQVLGRGFLHQPDFVQFDYQRCTQSGTIIILLLFSTLSLYRTVRHAWELREDLDEVGCFAKGPYRYDIIQGEDLRSSKNYEPRYKGKFYNLNVTPMISVCECTNCAI